MRNITTLGLAPVFGLILALITLAVPAFAFDGSSSVRLTYEETTGEKTSTKEYLIDPTADGYHIQLFNQGIKRVIVTGKDLDTRLEDYDNPATGDRLTFARKGEKLTLTGTLDGKPMDKSFDADGLWYGSVLLLRDAVLAGTEKIEFFVTKPETERVIKLVAIREGVEMLSIAGATCEAVKYKYTVPGFQGMFWKSYYWYRTSDGLLVQTEETRGMPGTPKVHSRLLVEDVLPAQPAVAALQ